MYLFAPTPWFYVTKKNFICHEFSYWLFWRGGGSHIKLNNFSKCWKKTLDWGCEVLITAPVCQKKLFNSSSPGQNGRHFADDIFRCIFMNEKICILIKISLKFVPKGPIDNNPALVQIMAWRQIGHKPLSEAMLIYLLTHICSTRGGWVNSLAPGRYGSNFKNIISEHMLEIKFMSC